MAEGYLNKIGGDRYTVKSAGLNPAEAVNPMVIEVMKEEGIDLSRNHPKAAFDFVKSGTLFSHVITVCDKETDASCPIFPGITKRENWPFPDPETAAGSYQEKLDQVRTIRDSIKAKIIDAFEL